MLNSSFIWCFVTRIAFSLKWIIFSFSDFGVHHISSPSTMTRGVVCWLLVAASQGWQQDVIWAAITWWLSLMPRTIWGWMGWDGKWWIWMNFVRLIKPRFVIVIDVQCRGISGRSYCWLKRRFHSWRFDREYDLGTGIEYAAFSKYGVGSLNLEKWIPNSQSEVKW